MQPDVSVVIAAYNAEEGVARAIRSALSQVGVTVEVVVVDDQSTDATVKIVRGFAGDGVRLVALTRNVGPGGARNAGLDVATGRWIAILDSDDTLLPDRLARMIALGESRQAQVVVDNLEVVQEGATTGDVMFPTGFLSAIEEINLADFIRSNILFKTTFNFGYMKPIFDREFLVRQAVRYEESLRIGEDYIFLASVLAKGGKCVVDPGTGYLYHIRQASISRVLEPRHVASMREADIRFEKQHVITGKARDAFDLR